MLWLAPGGPARIVDRGIEGPPDLVVEVVSPSSARRDRGPKRAVYGRLGVREYWVVDSDGRCVERYVNDGADVLEAVDQVTGGDALTSPMLAGFEVVVAALFRDLDA